VPCAWFARASVSRDILDLIRKFLISCLYHRPPSALSNNPTSLSFPLKDNFVDPKVPTPQAALLYTPDAPRSVTACRPCVLTYLFRAFTGVNSGKTLPFTIDKSSCLANAVYSLSY
jgi:hypothetical protein